MINFAKKKFFKIVFILFILIIICLICFENINRIKQNSLVAELKLLAKNLIQNKNLVKRLTSDLVEQESNIALNYYNEWKRYSNRDNWKGKDIITCDTDLPSIEEIDFNNIFYQTIPNTNEFFFYNAFYDNRGNQSYVRVVGIRRYPPKDNIW